jgi:hypothetical protein
VGLPLAILSAPVTKTKIDFGSAAEREAIPAKKIATKLIHFRNRNFSVPITFE